MLLGGILPFPALQRPLDKHPFHEVTVSCDSSSFMYKHFKHEVSEWHFDPENS